MSAVHNELGIFGKTSSQDYDASLNIKDGVITGFIPGEDFYPLPLNNALRDATFLQYCIADLLSDSPSSVECTFKYTILNNKIQDFVGDVHDVVDYWITNNAGKFATVKLADEIYQLDHEVSFPISGKPFINNAVEDVPDNNSSFVYTNGTTPSYDLSGNLAFNISLKDGAIQSNYKIYTNPNNESVWKSHFADGAITTEKILNYTVTKSKIPNAGVKTRNLSNYEITTQKLQDLSITNDKINNSSITSGKLANGSVTEVKLGTTKGFRDIIYPVQTSKIADEAVTTDKLSSTSQVNTSKLGVIDFNTNKIANNEIDDANKFTDVYSDRIHSEKIVSLSYSKLTGTLADAEKMTYLSPSYTPYTYFNISFYSSDWNVPSDKEFPSTGLWIANITIYYGYTTSDKTHYCNSAFCYGKNYPHGYQTEDDICVIGPLLFKDRLYCFHFRTHYNGQRELEIRYLDLTESYPTWKELSDLGLNEIGISLRKVGL